jgi:hypothetical protein
LVEDITLLKEIHNGSSGHGDLLRQCSINRGDVQRTILQRGEALHRKTFIGPSTGKPDSANPPD